MALTVDDRLRKVIEVYELEAFDCKTQSQNIDPDLFDLGKELFSSKFIGGEGDTACETCHLESKSFTDGLAISVGVGGGEGEGITRLLDGKGVMVPRNAFTLTGRGSKEFSAYFWDGRIQSENTDIVSPSGKLLDSRLKTILSVAAVQPILARDEFLGRVEFFSDNPHVDLVNNEYYSERFEAASDLLKSKFSSISSNVEAEKIINAAEKAGYKASEIDLSLIGNALASFIALELSCYSSPWVEYLNGNRDEITTEQKEGAILFYGKARCAACHSGSLFSDFQYHSLGLPQGGFGINALSSDEGRASLTHRQEDRYTFRTPPLLLVSETGPYGHNGTFDSLKGIIVFHVNPIPFLVNYEWKSDLEMLQFGKILSSRDPLLGYLDVISQREVDLIIDFLKAI